MPTQSPKTFGALMLQAFPMSGHRNRSPRSLVDDSPSAEPEPPNPPCLSPESAESDRWDDLVGIGVGGRISHAVTQIGSIIAGKYTLIDKIGEGGMRSVYLARQTEPVNRHVALKLIKVGMDSPKVLLRFEAERQALAMMDHPNIARVFDGGTTEAGRAFPGHGTGPRGANHPVLRSASSWPERRLELFVHVCHAVEHAHQKGNIHRDLKPANVLLTEVDGRPMPKVIDFGIAKGTERLLVDQSYGDTGLIVGTPMYMSPEQADPSLDIDTRTEYLRSRRHAL